MLRLCLILSATIMVIACQADGETPTSDTANETPAETLSQAPVTDGAYMLVQGKNYEPGSLAAYAAALPPIYAKYGGRYIALSTDFDIAEGDNDSQAIIITAWPDADAARAFWDSPEYREAIKLREGIGEFDVVIIPALGQ